MTVFYLRDLLAANPPTAGEKSTALPVDAIGANNATGVQETRALDTAKGAAQASIAHNSDASTVARDNYMARFTSAPLAAQTLSAETWTAALALSEGNAAANSFLNLSVYVWRPSTSAVVGFIYDSHTNLGVEWAAGEDGIVATFAGAAVTTLADDVLVLEVWRHAVQGMATAYAQTLYYNGATDVVDATTADAASYLSKPATVNFAAATEVLAPNAVYAGVGSLTVTGPVVTVLAGNAAYAATGSLTVSGAVVTVLAGNAAYAGTGALTQTGAFVTVLAPNATYPGVGGYIHTQYPPKLTRTVGEMQGLTVVELGKMFEPAALLPGVGSLLVHTIAPNASYPGVGGLTVGTAVVTVVAANTAYPGVGSLTQNGAVVTVFAGNAAYAGVGGLTITGPVVTVFAGNGAYPGTGSLSQSGAVVTVLAGSGVYPGTGSLTQSGAVVSVIAATSSYTGVGSLTTGTPVNGPYATNRVYPSDGFLTVSGWSIVSNGSVGPTVSYPAIGSLTVITPTPNTLYIRGAPGMPAITEVASSTMGSVSQEQASVPVIVVGMETPPVRLPVVQVSESSVPTGHADLSEPPVLVGSTR